MSMRRLVLASAVLLTVGAARSAPISQEDIQFVRYCIAEYNRSYLCDDARALKVWLRRSSPEERRALYREVTLAYAARRYLRNLSASERRERSRRALSNLTPEQGPWACTAWVAARYGVDVEENLRRLTRICVQPGHPAPVKEWERVFQPSGTTALNIEMLPGRLVDIYRAHPTDTVPVILLRMETDGALTGARGGAVLELTNLDPASVIRAVRGQEKPESILLGILHGDYLPERKKDARRALQRVVCGTNPALAGRARKILAVTPEEMGRRARQRQNDEENVWRCLLFYGRWHQRPPADPADSWDLIRDFELPGSPTLAPPRRQYVDDKPRRMHDDGLAAKRWADSRSPEALHRELDPLLSRLTPGYLPYASVAFLLAYRRVDTYANVRRALTLVDAPSRPAEPGELVRWWYGIPVLSEGEWPLRFSELYAVTKDAAIPRVLLRDPTSAQRDFHPQAWKNRDVAVARMFLRTPTTVLREAMRDDRYLANLAVALRDPALTATDRNKARSALVNLAQCDDPALAQAARSILHQSNQPRAGR